MRKRAGEVAVTDPQRPPRGETAETVALRADNANDLPVWRVARAAVMRAVSELTDTPLDDELHHEPD